MVMKELTFSGLFSVSNTFDGSEFLIFDGVHILLRKDAY